MFTGIIEEVGALESVRRRGGAAVLAVRARAVLEGTRVGDSIAVNGVCLTVTGLDAAAGRFAADAMPETLARSALGGMSAGAPVNLERALLPTTRLGGHIVSGHIDGTGIVASVVRDANAHLVEVAAPAHIMRYVVEKGSVALDGISLTVARVAAGSFVVSVIPHTFDNTGLSAKRAGDVLNVECDIVGKYVEKLMRPTADEPQRPSAVTMEFLAANGF